ncbi:hypothetical protein [Candidatus Binatus sp.]|uniref:hypothetical protein n=1 Tax=Candidatus Binatus sp. TaxID=2811406 RepID=UPI003BC48F49
MKVHQELTIGPLTTEQEGDLVDRLQRALSDGWSRNTAREEELNRTMVSTKLYCFVCTKHRDREAASLYLARPGDPSTALLYVSNIVPTELRELTYDQYNFIVSQFHARFVKPSADSLGIRVELSQPEQTLENWISPKTAKFLRAFSNRANKSTGSSHPKDRERWFDFLIAMHRAREKLDSGLLERWLTEEEKWPEDIAFDLICEFEFSEGLLRRFDR